MEFNHGNTPLPRPPCARGILPLRPDRAFCMHYRHLFHAGNFADVFKHVLLVGLLQALSRKDKPWCYLDTHAGAGSYNLASRDAGRTGEWQQGIGKLRADMGTPPTARRYLELVGWQDGRPELEHTRPYPGSPRLASLLARAGDRVVCCERMPEIAEQLRVHAPGAVVHLRDGYEAHSLLPPAEKRGLVLIDPPFEARDEFDRIAAFMRSAQQRFAAGIQAAWFPQKNAHEAQRFARRAVRDTRQDALLCLLDTGVASAGHLHACGLLIVNPPYGFAADAAAVLAWLTPRLALGPKAYHRIEPMAATGR